MSEAAFNPYAAPAEAGTAEPADGMWQTGGGVLMFRNGARLPEVDLYSGRDDVALTPASAEFAVAGGGMAVWRAVVLGAAAGVAVIGIIRDWFRVDPVAVVLGVFVLSLLMRLGAGKGERARLHWHVATATEKRRRRWNVAGSGIFFGAFALFVPAVVHGDPEWLAVGFGGLLAALVVVMVATRRFPRFMCPRKQDGWFHLSGVPEEALRVLQLRQGEAMRALLDAPKRVKPRKVCAFRGYRMSMRVLLGRHWWNPAFVLIVGFLKLTRSRQLVRDCLHWSEAEDLEEEKLDPSLREKWGGIAAMPEFGGWRRLNVMSIDSLVGDVRTQWVSLVSPDGCHSLVIAVVRVANARSSGEMMETTFRSWLRDGTIRLTSNQRLQKPHPAEMTVRRARGGIGRVWRRHLESLPAGEVAAAEFPDSWRLRMEEEMELRHRALERAGIYGPLRAEELEVRAR